ncbi:hypothetical protein D3C72_1280300 [compost metagenome]
MTPNSLPSSMRSCTKYPSEESTDRITSILAVFWYSGTFSIRTIAGLRALTNSRKLKNSAPASWWDSAYSSLFLLRPLLEAPVQGIPPITISHCVGFLLRFTAWMGDSIAIEFSSHSSGLLARDESRYDPSISTATAIELAIPDLLNPAWIALSSTPPPWKRLHTERGSPFSSLLVRRLTRSTTRSC